MGHRVRFSAQQRVGTYELVRPLGEGAFAEVWLARHHSSLGFSRQVAVKVLKPERDADPKYVQDLLAEAALLAELRHPSIVQVYSVEEIDGVVLVSMELVGGGSLLELLHAARRHRLRLPRAVVLDLGIQLCDGLDYAWNGRRDSGEPFHLVHRDLKPANLLLTEHGGLKIADFGLARRLGDPTQTATGTLKGTPCYVAPETLRGERRFTPTVDLFAVGCILSELWTGRVLYAADTLPAVVTRIIMGTPEQDADPIRADFPELAEFVAWALQRDPDRRLADPAAARRRLTELRRMCGPDPGVRTYLQLIGHLEAGSHVALGQIPTSDSDWVAIWRRVDPGTVDSTTGLAPAPLMQTAVEGEIGTARGGPSQLVAGDAAATWQEPTVPLPPPLPPTRTAIPEAAVESPPTGTESMETQGAGGDDLAATRPYRTTRRRRRVPQAPRGRIGSTTWLPFALGAVALALLIFVGLLLFRSDEPELEGNEPVSAVVPEARAPEDLEPASVASAAVPPAPHREEAPPTKARPIAESSPTSTPTPSPDPTPTPLPTAIQEATPTPTPEPTAPLRSTGCLAVVSDTPAPVFMGGSIAAGVSATSSPRFRERRPGAMTVGVGRFGAVEASAPVQLVAGDSVVVRCHLLGSRPVCTAETASGWRCD